MKKPTTKFRIGTGLRVCAGSLVISAFALSIAQAQVGFDGGTANPGDWNDPVNWTGDTLPSPAGLTDVGVNAAFGPAGSLANATANITGPLTTSTIGELRVGRGDSAVGVVNHSAGTLNTGGWSFVGVDATGAAASGTYNLSGTGVLTGGDVWHLGSGGGAGLSTGIMTVSDNASATFGALVVGVNDGNSGTLTQTGGSVAYNSWMTVGEQSGGQGTYDMSGGSLTQNADWLTVGEQSFANGTVSLSGTANVDLLGNGITLGRRVDGIGTLSIDGSTATFDTTQLFAGIDTDSLAGSGTATLDFTADINGVTPILASGDVRLNDGTGTGTSSLIVDMSLAPAGDILLVDVGGTLTGTFAGLAEGAGVAGSGGRNITYFGGDGNDIWLVVPEPTTMALLLMGAATVFAVRRKTS